MMAKPNGSVLRSAAYLPIGIAFIVATLAGETSFAAERYDAPRDGALIYADVCTFCHDENVGPDLRGRGLHPTYSRFIVRNGLNAMPAFRLAEIDDREIQALVDYVAALQPRVSGVAKP